MNDHPIRAIGMGGRAARKVGGKSLGRSGQHDVAAFGIEEDVANPRQPGEITHLVGGLSAAGEFFLQRRI